MVYNCGYQKKTDRTMSAAAKKAISDALKGRKLTQAQKDAIGEALRGNSNAVVGDGGQTKCGGKRKPNNRPSGLTYKKRSTTQKAGASAASAVPRA